MKYKNFNEWLEDYIKDNDVPHGSAKNVKDLMRGAWDAAIGQCAEIAKGHKCQLGRSDHEDQQDMTATIIMREIEELI